jgi:hypothetical protein
LQELGAVTAELVVRVAGALTIIARIAVVIA